MRVPGGLRVQQPVALGRPSSPQRTDLSAYPERGLPFTCEAKLAGPPKL